MIDELVQRFRRDGFVHARRVIDPRVLEGYARHVDDAVASRKQLDRRSLADKSLYEQSFIQCEYLWEEFPEIRALTFDPEVGRLAAALVGAPRLRLWHDQALYKEAGGRETEAHQDHPYWPIAEYATVTAWIPLVRIDEVNGCMGYVPGSHRGDVEYTDIFRTPGSGHALAARQETAPTFVCAEVGDVLFHDGRTIHLAQSNRSTEMRRVYTAIFFADGCTRAATGAHPSVDRGGVAAGAPIDSFATPISWPLPVGRYPEPGPWPEQATGWTARARELGVLPDPARGKGR